jgi:DNA-binding IclR family transcriptional regulator
MNTLVKSASRVLDVLEFLSVIEKPVGVSDVARRLRMPKSSSQALLTTLLARGYLVRSGLAYQLSPLVGSSGWIGGTMARLAQLARPVMDKAAETTGESVFLGVLTNDWHVQYVAKSVSRNEVRYDADLDYPRPAYCTSLGLAIIAHRAGDDIERFLSHGGFRNITPQTITDPAAVRRALQKARRDGYAEIRDGRVAGASGVSAPIFGPDAEPIAGINLAAPSGRYSRMRPLLTQHVLSSARALTQALGGIWPGASGGGANVPCTEARTRRRTVSRKTANT